jgi:ubiquinone/menaquinone biosynthesis C-methylase UbiE
VHVDVHARSHGHKETTMSAAGSKVSFETYGGSAPENYEQYFVPAIGVPFANALLHVAKLEPGELVLDVACGTGVVTRAAAERVAPGGAVAGLDMNPAMLATARAAVRDPSVEWHEAKAEEIPLPDGSFDAVLCSLGLQFFPDREAAAKEMRRVLKPGGRVAVATVAPSPLFEVLEQALAQHLSPAAAGFLRQVFALSDADTLRAVLGAAGFGEVAVTSSAVTPSLPSPTEFLWQYIRSTPLAAAVAELTAQARDALERDVVASWRPFVKDGVLDADLTAVLSTGWR